MGTKRRKPGWAFAAPREAVKVLNVCVTREDEGLTLWTEEYPELWRSADEADGSWPGQCLLPSLSASQKLSSSLERALQCSVLLSPSARGCRFIEVMEAVERVV